jgi:hypothetical protein
MVLIANIRTALSHMRKALLDYIVAKIIPRRPQKQLETCALLTG